LILRVRTFFFSAYKTDRACMHRNDRRGFAMIKRILIPLDSSPYTDTAIEMGCGLAKRHNAELTGLVVLDIPGIRETIRPVPLGGLYYVDVLEQSIRQDARNYIRKLLYTFRDKCRQAEVSYSQAERQGSPSERIIRESMFYDLVMIGMRTYYHFGVEFMIGSLTKYLIDEGKKPLIIGQ
jgi:nucleotide-binding universal stress UspA family protein